MLPKTSQDFSGFSWASPDVPDASPDLPSSLRPSQGFPGVLWFPRMSQGLPRASLGCPDVPGAPRGFPGVSWVSGRPRDFSRPPRAARTSQGLPRASLGRPDVPGGFPGPPWSLLRLTRSPTDRHDRPYPSGQRSSGRASTPKACFGICSLVRNFCSRAPLGGP